MSGVYNGIWRDYSSSSIITGTTLTLDVAGANYVLSALTFLVTIAGASFWNITAFVLHHFLTKKRSPDDVDLQHRVLLRNAPTVGSSIIWLVKIHLAWSSKKRKGLWLGTLILLLPALLTFLLFSAASILTSRVANKSYAGALAPILPSACGKIQYYNDTSSAAMSWTQSKSLNDTLRARSYVREFYFGAMSSASQFSVFPRAILPYTSSYDASCPFPNTSRCSLGEDKAFSVTTKLLDSHTDLGINAPPADRIQFQMEMVCSPLDIRDRIVTSQYNSQVSDYIFLGPLIGGSNSTYGALHEVVSTPLDYHLFSVSDLEYDTVPGALGWLPISDLNATKADNAVFFLSQYSVTYLSPVNDPFYAAHWALNFSQTSGPLEVRYAPDSLTTALGCTSQYVFCNPTSGHCTDPDSLISVSTPMFYPDVWSSSSTTTAQQQTRDRIVAGLMSGSPTMAAIAIGKQALWASGDLFYTISPGLPDYQWTYEVLGWFQTNLAMLQGHVLEFATKAGITPLPASLGGVADPITAQVDPNDKDLVAIRDAQRNQCYNQLVATTGLVQNFSFLGIMIIVCGSALIVLLDWSLESLVKLFARLRKTSSPSTGKLARETDGNLHLLRIALSDSGSGNEDTETTRWKMGFMDVPVRKPAQKHAARPTIVGDVAVFDSPARISVMEDASTLRSSVTAPFLSPKPSDAAAYHTQTGWIQTSPGWDHEATLYGSHP
jgi:hypothetical protein